MLYSQYLAAEEESIREGEEKTYKLIMQKAAFRVRSRPLLNLQFLPHFLPTLMSFSPKFCIFKYITSYCTSSSWGSYMQLQLREQPICGEWFLTGSTRPGAVPSPVRVDRCPQIKGPSAVIIQMSVCGCSVSQSGVASLLCKGITALSRKGLQPCYVRRYNLIR